MNHTRSEYNDDEMIRITMDSLHESMSRLALREQSVCEMICPRCGGTMRLNLIAGTREHIFAAMMCVDCWHCAPA